MSTMAGTYRIAATFDGHPGEDKLIEIEERLEPQGGWTVANPSEDTWSAVFDAPGTDPFDAVAGFRNLIEQFGQPLRVESSTWDLAEKESERTMPTLVGAAEVGEILKVSRQRVHQLAQTAAFPKPLVQVRMGPLWALSAIDAFAAAWERRAGRPAKKPAAARPAARKLTLAPAPRKSTAKRATAKKAAPVRHAAATSTKKRTKA